MLSYRTVLSAWNRFFFEERPTESIALFRIVWMSMILVYFLMDLVNIQDIYGPHGLISIETARSQFPIFHANLFQLVNPSYSFTYGLMTVYGISLVCSVLGLFTNYSLFVALICMTSLHQRNIWVLSSSETLMRIILIYLALSPCGHTLSLDSLLGRTNPRFRQKRSWPIWSLRLIQIQISVVYLWTVWHKIKGDTWVEGTAVYYATRLENMANFSIPYLMDSMLFLRLMTWGTLIIEVAIGALIWIKEFRKSVIIGAIFFHVGIEYVMCIPFFEINMMILLLAFVTPEEARSFVHKSASYLIKGIQDSGITLGVKEKLVFALRGNHETSY